jgi:sugar O-acyltransferase (sialic acid O-acetyltransferase NeuD family)
VKTLVVIGAGGNAREIAQIAGRCGYQVLGFVGDGEGRHDSPVLGNEDWLESHPVDCLAMGIGSPQHRLKVGTALAARFPHIEWPALVDPAAYVGSNCSLAPGSVVCVGAIATLNVSLGRFSQMNFGSTVGHETVIGDGCLINPGANISGGVSIGDCVLIGTGAQVLQYLSVGDGAVVGAGAVVTKSVPRGVTVVGIPAHLTTAK